MSRYTKTLTSLKVELGAIPKGMQQCHSFRYGKALLEGALEMDKEIIGSKSDTIMAAYIRSIRSAIKDVRA